MKKVMVMVMVLVLSFVFSGCDTPGFVPGDPNHGEETTDIATAVVIFHVGEEQSANPKLMKSVSVNSEDFLSNVQTICLQVFTEGSYEPVYGKCSPVIAGKYPDIEVNYNQLPAEPFKAKLVGYLHENVDWQNTSSILAMTNEKVFDGILVGLGIQDVYMGDLYAVDSVKVSLYISDSSRETDFADFQKVTLVTENGRKIEYNSDYEESENTDYKWSGFWIEKDQDYKMLCLDSECYYIYPEFDFFNSSSFDIAKAKKVEMIDVDSGSVCSIKYNQDFHKVIPVDAENKFIYEHYVSISDCDQSKYEFEVVVDTYDPDLKLTLSGDMNRYTINQNDELLYFRINQSFSDQSAYFYLSYDLVEPDLVGISFYPHMYVDVIDTETGQIVQTEEFDLTSFEFE